MGNLDERDRLKDNPFDYQMTKANKMMIFFHDKMIMTLSEKKSIKLDAKLTVADEFNQQLILAKATGNFKHGNERK